MNLKTYTPYVLVGLAFSTVVLAAVLIYRELEHRSTLTKSEADLHELMLRNTTLATELSESEERTRILEAEYTGEKNRNDEFEKKVQEVSESVGTLEKLRSLDKELLKKYSRVYFLNEHYEPKELTTIDETFVFDEGKTLYIHKNVREYLEDMLADAKSDGAELTVLSAYRSFGEQADLKNGYVVKYGSGANTFSADQGYSEHQLGTTVDLGTPLNGRSWNTFDQTKGYAWLLKNAHQYGFTLSYPKGNTYYQYEPWHWRFVGVALATYLHEEDLHLYELSEREIDSYLITIFD